MLILKESTKKIREKVQNEDENNLAKSIKRPQKLSERRKKCQNPAENPKNQQKPKKSWEICVSAKKPRAFRLKKKKGRGPVPNNSP